MSLRLVVKRWTDGFLCSLFILALVSVRSSGGEARQVWPAHEMQTVWITSSGFSPAQVTVSERMTVEWRNQDVLTHTVTSQIALWDSGDIAPGGTYSRTFALAGEYAYGCTYHPVMSGTVLVTADVYLPLVMNAFPPPAPAVPVLNDIDNADGDGDYEVSWGGVAGATGYTLEEDEEAGFGSPTTVYSGAAVSTTISGRGVGTYHYRIKASNASGSSDWSASKSVIVSVLAPAHGHYVGDQPVSFDVSRDKQVCNLYIRVPFATGPCWMRFISCTPTSGGRLALVDTGAQITGTWQTETYVTGDYSVQYCNGHYEFTPWTGTWEASRTSLLFRHTLAADFGGANDVYATDIDGDNDVDVLGAADSDDAIVWWENAGADLFVAHTITNTFNYVDSVYAIDMDEDNDVDILGVARFADTIAWWENDGSESFSGHVISDAFESAVDVYAVDLDGDTDVDILGAARFGDMIAWWENDGSENFAGHVITDTFGQPKSVHAIDVDGDTDIDILGAASTANTIAWWENDGNERFTAHIITDTFNGANSVHAIDLDKDGDVDIVGAAGDADTIAWWENDGSELFTAHIITDTFDSVSSVYVIDMDEDHDIDIVGAGYDADAIVWWENDGGEQFTAHVFVDAVDGPNSVFAADVNADGRMDVLGTSYNLIAWWEYLE